MEFAVCRKRAMGCGVWGVRPAPWPGLYKMGLWQLYVKIPNNVIAIIHGNYMLKYHTWQLYRKYHTML